MELRKRNWFQCQAVCTKVDEQTGKEVKRNYIALVDAVIYGEAEEIFTKKCTERFRAFIIKGIKDLGSQEVFSLEDDLISSLWYKITIAFNSIDDISGRGKVIKNSIFVESETIEEAQKNINDCLKVTAFEYKIVSVSLTAIEDIYPYEEQK